jgi:hypothetical protein
MDLYVMKLASSCRATPIHVEILLQLSLVWNQENNLHQVLNATKIFRGRNSNV